MKLNIDCWQLEAAQSPLNRASRALDTGALADGEVVVEVAGCGVCHTDLGFWHDGVRTRHPLPLTLGHEISGTVTHAGAGAERWVGQAVIVPAVIPCGDCEQCAQGRGAICERQVFPGNDDHGGFASHVVVPAEGLCPVDRSALAAAGLELADLAVVADAVTTPYQALRNAALAEGQLAVFVGIGGVGLFGVQIARAMGATVAALDVDPERVARAEAVGAAWTRVIAEGEAREIKRALRGWAAQAGLPKSGWRIFETSGHPAGQALAFSLLGPGAHLGVVGYTPERVPLRLSNLMALDATARGTWGCLPEHYPAVLELILAGQIDVRSYAERRPMGEINAVFEQLQAGELTRRPVLIPDFERGAQA